MKPAAYTCPRCGRQFSRRPLEHACERRSIDAHFEGKSPHVRVLFERLVGLARRRAPGGGRAPVQVSALKTMIAFNAPALMGGASPQKRALRVSLILPGVRSHPTLRRRYEMSSLKLSHQFLLASEEDLDEAFAALVSEARELAGGA